MWVKHGIEVDNLTHPKRFILYFVAFCERWGLIIQTILTFLKSDPGQHNEVTTVKRHWCSFLCDRRDYKGRYRHSRSSGVILLTLKVFHEQCSTIVVFLPSWRPRASEFVHLTARVTSWPERYTYWEHASKNKQEGLWHICLDHKVVLIVANMDAGERCPVFLLDLYSD